jgi:hypothetical protein
MLGVAKDVPKRAKEKKNDLERKEVFIGIEVLNAKRIWPLLGPRAQLGFSTENYSRSRLAVDWLEVATSD